MIDAKWYEQNILGHSTEKPYITEYTIEYLKDNGFSEQEIIEIISSVKGEYVFMKTFLIISMALLLKKINTIFIQSYKYYQSHQYLILII